MKKLLLKKVKEKTLKLKINFIYEVNGAKPLTSFVRVSTKLDIALQTDVNYIL